MSEQRLRTALTAFCNAFTNRGETTSLHEWNASMKATYDEAVLALGGYSAPKEHIDLSDSERSTYPTARVNIIQGIRKLALDGRLSEVGLSGLLMVCKLAERAVTGAEPLKDTPAIDNMTHPSHFSDGPFKKLYGHLYRKRLQCDRGTVGWGQYSELLDALITLRAVGAAPSAGPESVALTGQCDGQRGAMCHHQDPNDCDRERECPAFQADRPAAPPADVAGLVGHGDVHPMPYSATWQMKEAGGEAFLQYIELKGRGLTAMDFAEGIWHAMYRAYPALRATLPKQGMVMVPREPTQEILKAIANAIVVHGTAQKVYAAALAAAPERVWDEALAAALPQQTSQEQCHYCKQWFPSPVGLHHTQEECSNSTSAEALPQQGMVMLPADGPDVLTRCSHCGGLIDMKRDKLLEGLAAAPGARKEGT